MQYWVTAEKKKLSLDEMNTDHINNCINMLNGDVKNFNKLIIETLPGGYAVDISASEEVYKEIIKLTALKSVAGAYLQVLKKEMKTRKRM